jgi:hypothetical protein
MQTNPQRRNKVPKNISDVTCINRFISECSVRRCKPFLKRLLSSLTTLLTFIVALQFVARSCSLTQGKKMGEPASGQFHNQFNAGQYHEIYVQSDEGFRKSTGEADTVALFEAVRRKLGTVKNANQTTWHVNATPTGTLITLAYDVEYSEGKGTEQFVFQVRGDKALLFNYNVNSPLLITK